jgi:hypothetical protein
VCDLYINKESPPIISNPSRSKRAGGMKEQIVEQGLNLSGSEDKPTLTLTVPCPD